MFSLYSFDLEEHAITGKLFLHYKVASGEQEHSEFPISTSEVDLSRMEIKTIDLSPLEEFTDF